MLPPPPPKSNDEELEPKSDEPPPMDDGLLWYDGVYAGVAAATSLRALL